MGIGLEIYTRASAAAEWDRGESPESLGNTRDVASQTTQTPFTPVACTFKEGQ